MKIKVRYNNGCGSQDLIAIVGRKAIGEYSHYDKKWLEAKGRLTNSGGWYYPPTDYGCSNILIAKKETIEKGIKLLNSLDLSYELSRLANGVSYLYEIEDGTTKEIVWSE